jgi:N-acetylglutamate synthase-like GNAT family acetyltransferase/SAM-dependent methyltransferase
MRDVVPNDPETLKAAIRTRYGAAARQASTGAASCCGGVSCPSAPVCGDLYAIGEKSLLPEAAVLASLGCGNPTALAQLNQGETVLDLGSGGGIDVLLSARRVGPTGRVFGLDMTDEMLALARENARKAGVANVEFLKGDIEQIPLPDQSVDVIISNCVVNLAADKSRVLAEAFRVLRPGGRFAVSDIVVLGEVPEEIRRSAELWMGCIAGALEAEEFRRLLIAAGFGAVEIEPTRVYRTADVEAEVAGSGLDLAALAPYVDGKFAAAFVRARKAKDREGITLRPATAADAARVTALLQQASLPLDGVPADLAHFIVAETPEEGIIGVTGIELHDGAALLRSTAVEPSWQGSGVGRVLVEAMLAHALQCRAREVFLLTTTASGYFPKFGFVGVDRGAVPAAVQASAEFRGACPDSATAMRRGMPG